jgi:hypothetical protein
MVELVLNEITASFSIASRSRSAGRVGAVTKQYHADLAQRLPGASGYAPGQQMRANGPGSGHGASVYAPGFLK